MPKKPTTQKQPLLELEDLRSRLDEAEETLRAIRSGEVDALIVSGVGGEQVFTLKGADRSYRVLIEDMNEGALTMTAEGVILYANRRFGEMLKTPLEKVIGSAIHTWIVPDSQRILQSLLRKGVDEKRREQLVFTASDGTLVPVLLSVSNLLINEMPNSFCLVATDLTEQKRSDAIVASEKLARELLTASKQSRLALLSVIEDQTMAEAEIHRLNEELEQRVIDRTAQLNIVNKELEAFSYSVSHDLRTPLRSLDGFSQVLFEDYANQLDEQGKDYLQRIRKASQHMAELIDALLMLSRMTRKEMHYETVDLSTLAQATLAELRQTQPKRQIEVVVEEGLVVKGDPQLLRVVMENLLDNAWKYTSRQPEARIEVGALRQEDGKRTYFVRDNGAGFDMAFADKLFKAFQRLHTPNEFPGIGIGLATVQRIIHRHGGRIWAEGKVEKGATFFFTLPE